MWRSLPDEEKEKWRLEAMSRAVNNQQDINYEYLKVINPERKKKALAQLQKINPKENPEEAPGYTSSLSD